MPSREEDKASHYKEAIAQTCQEIHGLENLEGKRMSMRAIAVIPNGFLVLDSKPSVSPKETPRLWIL